MADARENRSAGRHRRDASRSGTRRARAASWSRSARACGKAHWYPRAICPFCASERSNGATASGRGTIYTFSVMRRVKEPYVIAHVTLAEGPTMLTNIVDCDFDKLADRPAGRGRIQGNRERPAGADVQAGVIFRFRESAMINKIVQSMAEALAGIRDGSLVLIGGFGSIGQPNALIDGLIEQGAKDLTVVANNAGVGHGGLARLMEVGRVRKIICSYPRTTDPVVFEELYRAGKIELEVMPQGTMAERMRAAGAGIPAFYTPTSVGTLLAEGKELREISGRNYVLEEAFHGDVALIEAWEADRWGNLTYKSSARNFNPVMATAAKLTIAQAQHIVDLGALDPEQVAHARNFRRSRGACALRRTDGDSNDEEAANEERTASWPPEAACKPWTREEIAARAAPRHPGRLVRQSRHRHSGAGGELRAAGSRSRHAVGERHPRHGPGAGAGRDQSLADQCQQEVRHAAFPAARTCIMPTVSPSSAAAISTFACSALSRWPRTAISPTGRSPTTDMPSVGGAMDLAVGAKAVSGC